MTANNVWYPNIWAEGVWGVTPTRRINYGVDTDQTNRLRRQPLKIVKRRRQAELLNVTKEYLEFKTKNKGLPA
jgi:hypothetical protein